MTREDHLRVIVAEEAVEVAQRASKCARFGCGEVQPGKGKNNAERLFLELTDLLTVVEMLAAGNPTVAAADESVAANGEELADAKREKVEHFLEYSDKCGRLDG